MSGLIFVEMCLNFSTLPLVCFCCFFLGLDLVKVQTLAGSYLLASELKHGHIWNAHVTIVSQAVCVPILKVSLRPVWWLILVAAWHTWEDRTSVEELLPSIGPWVCLWGLFLRVNSCKRSEPIWVVSSPLLVVASPRLYRKNSRIWAWEQVSKQHSSWFLLQFWLKLLLLLW